MENKDKLLDAKLKELRDWVTACGRPDKYYYWWSGVRSITWSFHHIIPNDSPVYDSAIKEVQEKIDEISKMAHAGYYKK